MAFQNKLLLILRVEDSGFYAQGEAGGYCKAELRGGRMLLTMAAQNLAELSGTFYGVLYYSGRGTVMCGPLQPHAKGLFLSCEINENALFTAKVYAAGIYYAESGFCYPVMLGHKGSGAAWQSEMTEGACTALQLRRGSNYKVWSFMDDTIEFTPSQQKELEREAAAEATPAPEPNARRVLREEEEEAERAPDFAAAPTPERLSADFFTRNAHHFEKLMRENQPVDELADLIPGSRWVRIDYSDAKGKSHYIVGIIYGENEQPLHICYGVPGDYAQTPPSELEGFCQWIPARAGSKEGYWMIYQSAQDGESCKVGKGAPVA